ncbi:hypothetical protein D3C87_1012680 [compost metagenome]
MKAARSARAIAGFFRPAPPVALVAGAIKNAPALDDEIIYPDGMNRRGKTGIRQSFPAAQHAAGLIACGQYRPSPAGGRCAQYGSLRKVKGHVAFEAHGKGGPDTGCKSQRAALRHGGNRPFQRLRIGARALFIIKRNIRQQLKCRGIDKPGTGNGSELQPSEPFRFEDIARIRGEIMQQRHHGRGFATPFIAIRRRQTPFRFGRQIISSAGRGKAKRCRSRRRRDDKGFVHALFSSFVNGRPNPWRTCFISSGGRIEGPPPEAAGHCRQSNLARTSLVVSMICSAACSAVSWP